jgi:hypothetical protein
MLLTYAEHAYLIGNRMAMANTTALTGIQLGYLPGLPVLLKHCQRCCS